MPRLGLMSDTHGREATARAAVSLLMGKGIDLLIHLGDVGSAGVLDAMVQPAKEPGGILQAHTVFGNTDWNAADLAAYARAVGIVPHDDLGWLDFSTCTVAFTHGHLPEVLAQAMQRQPTYLFHGHTHRMRDEKSGITRMINPGALHRAPKHTVALLDTESDSLEFFEVAAGHSPAV